MLVAQESFQSPEANFCSAGVVTQLELLSHAELSFPMTDKILLLKGRVDIVASSELMVHRLRIDTQHNLRISYKRVVFNVHASLNQFLVQILRNDGTDRMAVRSLDRHVHILTVFACRYSTVFDAT